MAKINLEGHYNEATGEIFPHIPAGIYPLRIVKIKRGKNQADSPMFPNCSHLQVEMKVREDHPDHAGHSLTMWLTVPDSDMSSSDFRNCLNKIKRLFMATDTEVADENPDDDDLHGAEFAGKVTASPMKADKNKFRNYVNDYLPLSSYDDAVVDDDD